MAKQTAYRVISGLMLLQAASCVSDTGEVPGSESFNNSIESLDEGELEQFLHVPSPEWSDQVIYFMLTDRFADGDPTNSDQGWGGYDPSDGKRWNGGDFQGILDHLDYIKGMGMTAIWVTPPVLNQRYDIDSIQTGYHGYWQESLLEVDPHLGTMDDYKRLSATLHKNGMYLMQDVVVNHVGDYFSYKGEYNPEDVTQNFVKHRDAPIQSPFDRNDANDPEDRELGIYNFMPMIQDFKDQMQKETYSLSGLDDLNTRNPEVQKILRSCFGYWIREAGVDAFRFDTPLYVDHPFWHDFMHNDDDPEAPGILPLARSLGKEHFYNIGEVWIPSKPFEDFAEKKAASYLGTPERPEMTSVLNFPLVSTIDRVFRSGAPTLEMTYRMESIERIFPEPKLLANFIDNHDAPRFRSGASFGQTSLALMYIFTIPGVPVLYYGTEQELRPLRGAMWAEGSDSGGEDHYDQQSRGYKLIQGLTELRRNHVAMRHGRWIALADNPYGAGLLGYRLEHAEEQLIVMMNTADHPVQAVVQTALEDGLVLEPVFALEDDEEELVISAGGKILNKMKPGSALVYRISDKVRSVHRAEDAVSMEPVTGDGNQAILKGQIDPDAEIDSMVLVIDGDYPRRVNIPLDQTPDWEQTIPVGYLQDGVHMLSQIAYLASGGVTVNQTALGVDWNWQLAVQSDDPLGDDHGPSGNYDYPLEEGFQGRNDIEAVTVYRTGTNLKIDIRMAREFSTAWLPTNGFDHLALELYFDLPEKTGFTEMPLRNAEIPEGMDWDYRAVLSAWSAAVYGNDGVTSKPGPGLQADVPTRTITLTIPAGTIGYPESLDGLKLYAVTWDVDEWGLRPLKPEATMWEYGGGNPEDPKIMDDIGILELDYLELD